MLLGTTESLCPHCLRVAPADLVEASEHVDMVTWCAEHGETRAVVWRGSPDYSSWRSRARTPTEPVASRSALAEDCPASCGLCEDHLRASCCVLVEVTQRCDLGCPVCYASSATASTPDPPLAEIGRRFEALASLAPRCNVQISGGEPTVRDDLPEIVSLGRSYGFSFFQLNSNGLRIAAEDGYADSLAEAGVSTVFLQFDGVTEEPYRRLRGAPLLGDKRRAIERCAAAGLGVVLVPTLVRGLNTGEIGAIVEAAVALLPAVRGVHFQPAAYLGRFDGRPGDGQRVTLPEVLRAIDEQTQGRLPLSAFKPSGCEHSLCSFSGEFCRLADGRITPLARDGVAEGVADPLLKAELTARRWTAVKPACCCAGAKGDGGASVSPVKAAGNAGAQENQWDTLIAEVKGSTFSVSCMTFQDAWTIDLQRLRQCALHVLSADLRLVPFCAYNLTDSRGRPFRGAWQGRLRLPVGVQ